MKTGWTCTEWRSAASSDCQVEVCQIAQWFNGDWAWN